MTDISIVTQAARTSFKIAASYHYSVGGPRGIVCTATSAGYERRVNTLLTCGHRRPTLAAVRSLGRAGIAVAVMAPQRPALCFWSRYATSTMLVPDAEQRPDLFTREIIEQAHGRAVHMILPGSDAATVALSGVLDALPESCARVLPRKDAALRASQRSLLFDLGESIGVRTLPRITVDDAERVEPALREVKKLGFPALVRPMGDGDKISGNITVTSIGELRRLLYARPDLVDGGCLVEPRPAGETLGYGTVCDDGEVLVEVFQRRVRERQVLSGVSAVAETVTPDREVRDAGRALLAALRWRGPAMLEFIKEANGTLRLVQMTPRIWGSLSLSIRAGVDVPLLCDHLARGERVGTGRVAPAGFRVRWLLGDFRQMWDTASGRIDPGGTGPYALRRARAAMTFFDPRALAHTRTDVLDADDPMPFVFEMQGAVAGKH